MAMGGINRDKPDRWKADIAQSVDLYNDWFMRFAPTTYRETRVKTAGQVEFALVSTDNLNNISPDLLTKCPGVLPMLRMSTCPPIARDRLIGLARVSKHLVQCMEDPDRPRLPPKMSSSQLREELTKIGATIHKMADPDIFVWLRRSQAATSQEVHRAATIVADRLCGAMSDPIIRNAQERRQLAAIGQWLEARGYKPIPASNSTKFNQMPRGTFAFRRNVSVRMSSDTGEQNLVNIPIDAVVMPRLAARGDLPLLIEAKSAGDFTNVNKRRKEEAQKMTQLRNTYGGGIRFGLLLCGYFDTGYLGYEAAEGIDWVWEHRLDDLAQYGL